MVYVVYLRYNIYCMVYIVYLRYNMYCMVYVVYLRYNIYCMVYVVYLRYNIYCMVNFVYLRYNIYRIHCLSFCPLSCGHCYFCLWICGFWLPPLWYLQVCLALRHSSSVHIDFTSLTFGYISLLTILKTTIISQKENWSISCLNAKVLTQKR
jgi:hypothetical protein